MAKIYTETCEVCRRPFEVDSLTHLKGTKTCSAACFRLRKHQREKDRWQKRYGKDAQ